GGGCVAHCTQWWWTESRQCCRCPGLGSVSPTLSIVTIISTGSNSTWPASRAAARRPLHPEKALPAGTNCPNRRFARLGQPFPASGTACIPLLHDARLL